MSSFHSLISTNFSYLQMEAIEQSKQSLDEISNVSRWPMEMAEEWPQQDNGDDCGVFLAVGCECIALGVPMMMNKGESCFFRRKMGVDILKGHLVY